jgi:putative membrane protein insertion efficiency factor
MTNRNRLFVFLINLYQKYISGAFPPSCRFYPSCSEYSKQAFMRYNFFKAFVLSFYRILRCNPWNKGGYDPLK